MDYTYKNMLKAGLQAIIGQPSRPICTHQAAHTFCPLEKRPNLQPLDPPLFSIDQFSLHICLLTIDTNQADKS